MLIDGRSISGNEEEGWMSTKTGFSVSSYRCLFKMRAFAEGKWIVVQQPAYTRIRHFKNQKCIL
jgi:hypothetical protein